jgi:PP-loop superfamily ATP-utilizing enzyme
MERALELSTEIEQRIKACGYRFVALDLKGFQSGSLNQGVIKLKRVGD